MEPQGQNRQTFTFGTWNVQGLAKKKVDVVAEIERENEDIVVLTETKIRGVGKEDLGNYVHLYSAITYNGGVPRAGVSILIRKEFARNLEWEGVSERLIWAKLRICNRVVVVIGVYWVDNCRPQNIKDQFQSKLEKVIGDFRDDYEVIILGDFNAWVSGTSAESDIVGSFGVNELNNNGVRLKNVCKEYKLKIQNTFFKHRDVHKYTWYGSGNRKTLVDYCITKQDSELEVQDVVACRWLECGTDHIFLEATVSFPFVSDNQQPDSRTLEIPKYKSYLLFSKNMRVLYKEILDSLIDLSFNRTTDEMYEHLKESIHIAAQSALGLVDPDRFGEFLWDSEIRELRWSRMYQRTNIPEPNSYDYNIDGGLKNEIWEGICADVNSKGKIKKYRAVRSILEELFNRNADDKAVSISMNSLETFFKNRFTETRVDFMKSNCTEQRFYQVHQNQLLPISVTDVEVALDDLDYCNHSSPGGLSAMLLKYSSTKTKRLLRDLIQNIFSGENIPNEISETYIYVLSNNKNKPKSCSSVHVMHPIMNIMCSILKRALEKIPSVNSASIPNEPQLDTTFMLRLILQKNATKQEDLVHFSVIDLAKSYASVPLVKVFETLKAAGVDEDLIDLTKRLTEGNSVRVIRGNEPSEAFQLTKGLKSSCTLASLLFNMYISEALKVWSQDIGSDGLRIGNHDLSFIYSDDKLTIFAKNKGNLESMLGKLTKILKTIGLQITPQIVSYMGSENLRLGDEIIPGELTLDYQGSVLEKNGGNEADITTRVLEIKNIIGLLHPTARDEMITDKNKRRIFNSIVKGFLTYGCETWTVTEPLKRQITAAELRYWKWCCDGFQRKLTSTKMLELMKVNQTVSNVIMLKKAAWYTKVKEMSADHWAKRVFEWDPEGKRKAVKPRAKWVDGVEDFITTMGQYSRHLLKSEGIAKLMIENARKEDKKEDTYAT